ncbi:hypothetical protein K461DRAFT_289909 [Myriangium duriaei CBS 260.36]|uniref:CUE domain-containing protein n=1 Tax=Myriangium duriaei CBS 260.36 TaxID=1168546 RepID=A0A9P4JCJ6_9PEZI|nr:hypothetical protein K461DRAFT_289909 [Myriangium duriaei CBS 260.36]
MPDNKEHEKGSGAESPTTGKQFDFDDDHETQDVHTTGTSKPLPASVEDEGGPPAKPPRPSSPQQQAENTLIEAFPSIDAKVVKAVLTASGGQVEPAFNALLGMSDPTFQAEDVPPPQPPRPTAAQRQLEQDEMYARQLAQHYQSGDRDHRGGYQQQRGQGPPQHRNSQDPEDRERNFFDDDLPEIRESVRQGFLQTQSTVNSWIKNFKKRLDGDEDDPYSGPTRLDPPPPRRDDSHSEWPRPAQRLPRRSGDYDADPRELGDDFTSLELRDDEAPPPKPARPAANPDLFKPTPAPPQSGPVDEVDAAERRTPGGGAGAKKWQSLTAVAAQPEPDDDPFSVGDSEDEKDASKSKDVREADTARLKEAASKSTGEVEKETKPLEERKRGSISTKDKDAEDLLTGKK